MDKDWKLQRYSRKDYTDLVDFPVEIVGRDGVVRRYSYEDSVRLYQRRITFAPIRYRDHELVDAEVGHCRSRIDQLRRSYYHRFGWGTPEGEPEPLEVFGEVAGELAAFLCRVFEAEGRPDVVVTSVADPRDPISTWYVRRPAADQGMLLYVHRFDGDTGEQVREQFFGQVKALERVDPTDGDREHLVAFHHAVDCGFALTARAGEHEGLQGLRRTRPGPDPRPTPWERALDVIRRGDFDEALDQCRSILDAQPWHRSAYVAGAVVATALQRHFEAEDFALLGAHYFPDDAALHHYVGLARYRLDRLDEAAGALERSLEIDPAQASTRFLLASVRVDQGDRAAARAVVAAGREHEASDRRAGEALERLDQWMRWSRVMRVGAGVAFALGLVALLAGGPLGLLPIGLAVILAGAGALVFRRQLGRLRARQRYDELSQGLRRVHRRARPEEPPVS